tara:strand:+ start:822 stop:1211 length:390 start_codon:yes stop_codon:yes gene_type:complete
MSTRAQIRFATREAGQSFNQHPSAIHAQFYKHSDGYPEGLGVDIADSIMNNVGLNNIEIEPLTAKHGDLEYIYYVWQAPGKETFISIFEVNGFGYCETCGQDVKTEDQCIFVGMPTELINKYSQTKNES